MYGSNKDPCYLFPEIFFRESNPPTIRYVRTGERDGEKKRKRSLGIRERIREEVVRF